MKAVVTGGAGFIGSHLVNELYKIGFEIEIVDNKPNTTYRITDEIDHHGFIRHHGLDIADPDNKEFLAAMMEDADKVFHLAALTNTSESNDYPLRYHHNNVTGTLHILEAALQAKVGKVIFTSSKDVYGITNASAINEADVLEPMSQYGMTKMICEELCMLYSRIYNLNTVTLRLFDVYGPGDNTSEISNYLDWHHRNEPIFVQGNGLRSRDFVHVDDVVNALLTVSGLDYNDGNIFNIGSGEEYCMNEIAKMIDEKNIEHVADSDEPFRIVADIEAAKDMLGWKPQRDIKDVLHRMARDTSQ